MLRDIRTFGLARQYIIPPANAEVAATVAPATHAILKRKFDQENKKKTFFEFSQFLYRRDKYSFWTAFLRTLGSDFSQ
jgi:hypothetical protein